MEKEDSDDPFDSAPFDELKIKKHLQKQTSTNLFIEYLTDKNSNLIGAKKLSSPKNLDQIQLIESTKKLKQTLNTSFIRTNFNNKNPINLSNNLSNGLSNSLSNLNQNQKPTNDLIWL